MKQHPHIIQIKLIPQIVKCNPTLHSDTDVEWNLILETH